MMCDTNDVVLMNFSWESLWLEISKKAPTLTSILCSSILDKGKSEQEKKPVICICAALLSKFRNPKILTQVHNYFLKLLATCLFATTEFVQVYQILQKCMITQSRIPYDRLGEGFDQPVLEWQDELVKILQQHNFK